MSHIHLHPENLIQLQMGSYLLTVNQFVFLIGKDSLMNFEVILKVYSKLNLICQYDY
jgi:hypothetical protein